MVQNSNQSRKIRIYPTPKQIRMINLNLAIVRKSYNFAVDLQKEEYKEWNEVYTKHKSELKEKGIDGAELKAQMKQFTAENKTFDSVWKVQKTKYEKQGLTATEILKKREELLENRNGNWYISPLSRIRLLWKNKVQSTPELSWMLAGDVNARERAILMDFKRGIETFESKFLQAIDKVKKKRAENFKKGILKEYKYPEAYGFPEFKGPRNKVTSYRTAIQTSWVDPQKHRIKLPKIGWVKTSVNQDFTCLPDVSTLSDPQILTNGREYYFKYACYDDFTPIDAPQTDILGVAIRLKNLATLSNGMVVTNFAKDPKIVKYTAKIKELQKELSRLKDHGKSHVFRPYVISKEELEKIPAEKRGKVLAEAARQRYKLSTNRTRKIERLIRKKQILIENRKDYLRKAACVKIVETNPKGIIFETFDKEFLKQDTRFAKMVQVTGMYEFERCLAWHARKHCIPVKRTTPYFASAQICSHCGNVVREMSDPKHKVFECPKCGLILDRNVNASINIKKAWDTAEDYFIEKK